MFYFYVCFCMYYLCLMILLFPKVHASFFHPSSPFTSFHFFIYGNLRPSSTPAFWRSILSWSQFMSFISLKLLLNKWWRLHFTFPSLSLCSCNSIRAQYKDLCGFWFCAPPKQLAHCLKYVNTALWTVCVSSKFICWNLAPNVMIFGGGAVGR